MTLYKTNDLKNGDRVKLRNGWEAIMRDNKRGNIRYAEVFGSWRGRNETGETGSIYSHDIVKALRDGIWVPIQLTKSQNDLISKLHGVVYVTV